MPEHGRVFPDKGRDPKRQVGPYRQELKEWSNRLASDEAQKAKPLGPRPTPPPGAGPYWESNNARALEAWDKED